MSSVTDATDSSGNDSQSNVDEYRKVDFNGVIDTDVLDPFIRHAKEIYSEYTVVINRYGWHIRVVDPSNVTQMDARIHVDDWEQYDSVRDGPVGVSHESLEEMVSFVDATSGNAHVSIDDGRLTMSDGDRLFTDTRLIDPDSVRMRPDRLDMEVRSSVTVGQGNNDMWDLTKWVRSNSSNKTVQMDVNWDRIQFEAQNYSGDTNDSHEVHGDSDDREDVTASYSMDMLYSILKKPLKAHLTEVPYTFSFLQNDNMDTAVLKVSREYDSESKLNFTIAPRVS